VGIFRGKVGYGENHALKKVARLVNYTSKYLNMDNSTCYYNIRTVDSQLIKEIVNVIPPLRELLLNGLVTHII